MSPIIVQPDTFNSTLSSSCNATVGSSKLHYSVVAAATNVSPAPPSSIAAPAVTPVAAPALPGGAVIDPAFPMATAEIMTSTELSFCLVDSLAFFKCLTWEQTPWAPVYIETNMKGEDGTKTKQAANPLNRADAATIHHHLHHRLRDVHPSTIRNGLFLGSAYPIAGGAVGPIGTYPHLFVVFPHAQTFVATNATFLRIWHDQIVKPAFDRAWRDSGLATLYGAEIDGRTRILQPTGVRTSNDAPSSDGMLIRLAKHKLDVVRCFWPQWSENDSGRHVEVMTAAWDAIKGILKDHPDLAEFQNPILLAISRGGHDFSGHVSFDDMFHNVSREWEKYTDPQYAVPGSSKIKFCTTMEYSEEPDPEEDTYEDFMVTSIFDAPGNEATSAPQPPADEEMSEAELKLSKEEQRGRKRLLDDEDGNSDHVRNKCRKRQHKPVIEDDHNDVALFKSHHSKRN